MLSAPVHSGNHMVDYSVDTRRRVVLLKEEWQSGKSTTLVQAGLFPFIYLFLFLTTLCGGECFYLCVYITCGCLVSEKA